MLQRLTIDHTHDELRLVLGDIVSQGTRNIFVSVPELKKTLTIVVSAITMTPEGGLRIIGYLNEMLVNIDSSPGETPSITTS